MYAFGGDAVRKAAFLSALTGSHEVVVRARVYADATTTTPVAGGEDLAVDAGSVRVDAGSGVRRVLSATIASPDGKSSTLRSLLTTSGREVGVERGIRYPNGRVDLVPVGRFRIDTVEDSLESPGAVDVTCPDHAARVLDDRFLSPRSGTVGIPIAEQIRRLIQGTIPGVSVYTPPTSPNVRAGVVWEEDRWEAVVALADSIGCVVYADPTGAFQVAPAKTLVDPPDWLIDSGARGVLLGGKRAATREAVYNSVRASSSPTDGSDPVYAIAEDTDVTSSTYVSGPFGRVPRFYDSPLLVTTAQCLTAAQAILARSIGVRSGLTLSSIVNPALDVGDRVDVFLPDGGLQRHVIASFTLPLDPESPMSIETRAA